MNRWPNFFIVGAPKAGTTSLYEYLNEVPEIFMSPIKEPNYFSPIVSKQNNLIRINNEKKYQDLFKNVKKEICIGEASPSYLRDPKAPVLIHEKIPKAKIIIMLRDPVERSFSHFLHRIRRGHNISFNLTLKKYIETKNKESEFFKFMVNPSLYYKQIKIFLEIFGSEQVKIIIFEEFVQDVYKSVNEVLKFLNINSDVPQNISKTYNPYLEPRNQVIMSILGSNKIRKTARSIIPRKVRNAISGNILNKPSEKPKIDKESKEILTKFYSDEVEKLENLLGRKLPWKNF